MKHSLAKVSLILLLGVIIGAVFSEVIGLFLTPGSVAHEVFVRYRDFGNGVTLNLVVMEIAFSIKIHVNLMSVVGVFIASQLLRWYRF
ncbi:MAG: DUF4321 domain-containing protein [Candidatus Krumholzibacteriia bacterium]